MKWRCAAQDDKREQQTLNPHSRLLQFFAKFWAEGSGFAAGRRSFNDEKRAILGSIEAPKRKISAYGLEADVHAAPLMSA
jgi:hypothetical protein